MGKSTVSNIITETCDATYNVLSKAFLQPPLSADEWLAIAKDFEEQWNLPHVVGALDEKHIRIQCLPDTGTLFHNYKGFFSQDFFSKCDQISSKLWILSHVLKKCLRENFEFL